jgi:hypothetical protein
MKQHELFTVTDSKLHSSQSLSSCVASSLWCLEIKMEGLKSHRQMLFIFSLITSFDPDRPFSGDSWGIYKSWRSTYNKNVWEELFAYFTLIRDGPHRGKYTDTQTTRWSHKPKIMRHTQTDAQTGGWSREPPFNSTKQEKWAKNYNANMNLLVELGRIWLNTRYTH